MSTVSTPQGEARFQRTVKVRDYESATASVSIQFDLPDMAPGSAGYGDAVMAQVRGAMFQAKAAVLSELGIDFTVEQGGIVRELIAGTFGNVTEVAAAPVAAAPTYTPAPSLAPAPAMAAPAPQPVAAPAAAPAGDASQPPHSPDTQDRDEKRANSAWAKGRLATNPDEFWDNRTSKRNPNAPDYKHKDSGIGVWLS
jgi:hypothetical protein